VSPWDYLRRRLALWLCPAIDTARGKCHLEQVARECGASRSVAKAIASKFFRTLYDV
jgi:hypothetical protein